MKWDGIGEDGKGWIGAGGGCLVGLYRAKRRNGNHKLKLMKVSTLVRKHTRGVRFGGLLLLLDGMLERGPRLLYLLSHACFSLLGLLGLLARRQGRGGVQG